MWFGNGLSTEVWLLVFQEFSSDCLASIGASRVSDRPANVGGVLWPGSGVVVVHEWTDGEVVRVAKARFESGDEGGRRREGKMGRCVVDLSEERGHGQRIQS
jgi:hypothetical protein